MADILSPNLASNFLLQESRERGEVLTNLKLQKLLYYAQAWHLALNREPLFAEEFQAWVHGPVLPSQYHRFRDFRWHPISVEVEKPAASDVVSAHLSEILDVFGPETAVGLEIMTHRERPWLNARGNLPPTEPCSHVIPKADMEAFYRELGNAASN